MPWQHRLPISSPHFTPDSQRKDLQLQAAASAQEGYFRALQAKLRAGDDLTEKDVQHVSVEKLRTLLPRSLPPGMPLSDAEVARLQGSREWTPALLQLARLIQAKADESRFGHDTGYEGPRVGGTGPEPYDPLSSRHVAVPKGLLGGESLRSLYDRHMAGYDARLRKAQAELAAEGKQLRDEPGAGGKGSIRQAYAEAFEKERALRVDLARKEYAALPARVRAEMVEEFRLKYQETLKVLAPVADAPLVFLTTSGSKDAVAEPADPATAARLRADALWAKGLNLTDQGRWRMTPLGQGMLEQRGVDVMRRREQPGFFTGPLAFPTQEPALPGFRPQAPSAAAESSGSLASLSSQLARHTKDWQAYVDRLETVRGQALRFLSSVGEEHRRLAKAGPEADEVYKSLDDRVRSAEAFLRQTQEDLNDARPRLSQLSSRAELVSKVARGAAYSAADAQKYTSRGDQLEYVANREGDLPMPSGKYRGVRVKDVPIDHLLHLHTGVYRVNRVRHDRYEGKVLPRPLDLEEVEMYESSNNMLEQVRRYLASPEGRARLRDFEHELEQRLQPIADKVMRKADADAERVAAMEEESRRSRGVVQRQDRLVTQIAGIDAEIAHHTDRSGASLAQSALASEMRTEAEKNEALRRRYDALSADDPERKTLGLEYSLRRARIARLLDAFSGREADHGRVAALVEQRQRLQGELERLRGKDPLFTSVPPEPLDLSEYTSEVGRIQARAERWAAKKPGRKPENYLAWRVGIKGRREAGPEVRGLNAAPGAAEERYDRLLSIAAKQSLKRKARREADERGWAGVHQKLVDAGSSPEEAKRLVGRMKREVRYEAKGDGGWFTPLSFAEQSGEGDRETRKQQRRRWDKEGEQAEERYWRKILLNPLVQQEWKYLFTADPHSLREDPTLQKDKEGRYENPVMAARAKVRKYLEDVESYLFWHNARNPDLPMGLSEFRQTQRMPFTDREGLWLPPPREPFIDVRGVLGGDYQYAKDQLKQVVARHDPSWRSSPEWRSLGFAVTDEGETRKGSYSKKAHMQVYDDLYIRVGEATSLKQIDALRDEALYAFLGGARPADEATPEDFKQSLEGRHPVSGKQLLYEGATDNPMHRLLLDEIAARRKALEAFGGVAVESYGASFALERGRRLTDLRDAARFAGEEAERYAAWLFGEGDEAVEERYRLEREDPEALLRLRDRPAAPEWEPPDEAYRQKQLDEPVPYAFDEDDEGPQVMGKRRG